MNSAIAMYRQKSTKLGFYIIKLKIPETFFVIHQRRNKMLTWNVIRKNRLIFSTWFNTRK